MNPRAKYLGLPLFINKNKKSFEEINAKILNNVEMEGQNPFTSSQNYINKISNTCIH